MTANGPIRRSADTARGIAVLGGSFNPPHQTHLRLAKAALAMLPIDEVRVIPSGDHPHKRGRDMASGADRLAMCRLCFAAVPGVVVDDRELHRAGPSFTVDTLLELHREQPDRRIFFLIGSDNLPLLPTWRDHHRILQLATVVTYPRLGYPIDGNALQGMDLTADERAQLLANVLSMPADDIAASRLREQWRHGERHLPELPAAVVDYLSAHSIYGP